MGDGGGRKRCECYGSRVNYLAHSLRFLDQPAVLVGACLPDMLSALDRKCRMRDRNVRPFLDDADPFTADIARGVLAHLDDDHWFHGTEAFLVTSSRLSKAIRAVLPTDESHRVGFLGHILTEILLDRWLIGRDDTLLDRFHSQLETLDPVAIQDVVNQLATRPTERIAEMYPRMIAERFLDDYPFDEKLLRRLNGIMKRVGLPKLPPEFAGELSGLFAIVERSAFTLLPPDVRDRV